MGPSEVICSIILPFSLADEMYPALPSWQRGDMLHLPSGDSLLGVATPAS